MSRGEWGRFVRDFWWQLGVILFATVAWVVRVEAAVSRVESVTNVESLTEALVRLECIRDLQRAELAGVPCNSLLGDRRIR